MMEFSNMVTYADEDVAVWCFCLVGWLEAGESFWGHGSIPVRRASQQCIQAMHPANILPIYPGIASWQYILVIYPGIFLLVIYPGMYLLVIYPGIFLHL